MPPVFMDSYGLIAVADPEEGRGSGVVIPHPPALSKLNSPNIDQNCQTISIIHSKFTRVVPQVEALP